MTITEIAVDLIRERDQLKKRVRELEADVAAYMKDVDDMAKQRDLFEVRIAKAKAILCATIPQSQLALEITRAVEALEGK